MNCGCGSLFKYKISVIVPIYNVEEYIENCLKSLVNQTINKNELEVLLINDGSSDRSEEICKEYAAKYPYFKYFSKENEGVSKTRNFGIEHSQGKYFAFLDPDDELTAESLENLVKFFDKHENEIDIVTYKIIPVFNGEQRGSLHYRYKYMDREGVYDLERPENIFIAQTTVNICVKNKGTGKNVLFDTDIFFHEDQKYNMEVTREKMKLGYCEGAKYLYTKNPASATNTKLYAYYIFEQTMEFWENFFGSFKERVPQYFQAMYVSDLNWKSKMDSLLPYHYDEPDFNRAVERICTLLRRVDDSVILTFPGMENAHRYYWISMKDKDAFSVKAGLNNVSIFRDDKPVFSDKSIPLSVGRFRVDEEKVYIDAFARSPIFTFCEKPEIYAHVSNEYGVVDIPVELEPSAWDYYQMKVKTSKFWRIRFNWDYKKYRRIFFTVVVNGERLPVRLEFSSFVPFGNGVPRIMIFRSGYKFVQRQNGFDAHKSSLAEETAQMNAFHKKILRQKPRTVAWRIFYSKSVPTDKKIWLYYDCRNVYKDNGYYQFIHDFEMNDGVERYYVVNDDIDRKALFTPKQRKNVIRFGSLKHRKLFLAAEKVITAFAEYNNYNPFHIKLWKYYSDMFKAEVIYLQHGVLHAFVPWKYSNDRLNTMDREVVSTTFEVKNLTENYGFRDCDLIKAGMPRYDFIDAADAKSEKKILFAPTWRKYLIGMDSSGEFCADSDKFKISFFYQETLKFLQSKELHDCLEKNDWYLDFKLHPIFSCYSDFYKLESDRIRLADKSVDEKSYKIFVTDYSSFCFDFVYLKKTMMYFVPDIEMFKAGMNDYRKLDLPLEEGFGPLACDCETAVSQLCELVERGGEPEKIYAERMDGFFINNDKNCRERIYNAIK